MKLSNARIEIEFCDQSGAMRRLLDKKTGQAYFNNSNQLAFRLELSENFYQESFEEFSWRQNGDGLLLCWKINQEIDVRAAVQLLEKGCRFTASVENRGESVVCSLEYPLLDGLVRLAEDGSDSLAHSYATGILCHDPFQCFSKTGSGLRYMPYPEGFSGATMQFFCYYAPGAGGLHFAAYDSKYHQKWLNFYRAENGMRVSQIFGYEDIGAAKGPSMEWPFELHLLDGNSDWYESAELYRQWALNQPWCRQGRMQDKNPDEKAGWLLEKTGAATFGVNAKYDRSQWLTRYRQDIGTPLFHVLGPDWAKAGQDYVDHLPGKLEEWFPADFAPENLKTIQENGDRFAPFEFDFLTPATVLEDKTIAGSLQKWPDSPKSTDQYPFSMLCPLCDYTKKVHAERDRRLVEESDCDSLYYDISANNILKTCMDPSHGHPVGAGRQMTEAYREIYRETRRAAQTQKGSYVAMGTEMINEVFLDCLDYYQARAFAQPCSSFEVWPCHDLLVKGQAEMIPLFQYVYSGYGPLRLDGWGKLVEEGGDIIFHTIAKTYLWGGLFEINAEYSPMEDLGQGENSPEEHYYPFTPRGFRYSGRMAKYLSRFAKLRVSELGRFLQYGRMKMPPKVRSRKIKRSWFQYNGNDSSIEQNTRGVISLDAVLSSCWELDGKTAVFMANTTGFSQKAAVEWGALEAGGKNCVVREFRDAEAETVKKLEKLPDSIVMEPWQTAIYLFES